MSITHESCCDIKNNNYNVNNPKISKDKQPRHQQQCQAYQLKIQFDRSPQRDGESKEATSTTVGESDDIFLEQHFKQHGLSDSIC